MATHDPDWQEYDRELTPKEKDRGFTGYRCRVCNRTIKVPPGGMPSLGKHS